MFNHVGHLTLVPDVTEAQIDGIVDGLLGLPAQIDGLLEAQVVRDAGLTPGNANLRFHMRFESVEAWQAYKTHPAHVAVAAGHIRPMLGSASFVQYTDDAVQSTTA
jgi:hypothetical protein